MERVYVCARVGEGYRVIVEGFVSLSLFDGDILTSR